MENFDGLNKVKTKDELILFLLEEYESAQDACIHEYSTDSSRDQKLLNMFSENVKEKLKLLSD